MHRNLPETHSHAPSGLAEIHADMAWVSRENLSFRPGMALDDQLPAVDANSCSVRQRSPGGRDAVARVGGRGECRQWRCRGRRLTCSEPRLSPHAADQAHQRLAVTLALIFVIVVEDDMRIGRGLSERANRVHE